MIAVTILYSANPDVRFQAAYYTENARDSDCEEATV